jgi:hypothetical protein
MSKVKTTFFCQNCGLNTKGNATPGMKEIIQKQEKSLEENETSCKTFTNKRNRFCSRNPHG